MPEECPHWDGLECTLISEEDLKKLKDAYRKYQQDEYDYFEDFIRQCEKILT